MDSDLVELILTVVVFVVAPLVQRLLSRGRSADRPGAAPEPDAVEPAPATNPDEPPPAYPDDAPGAYPAGAPSPRPDRAHPAPYPAGAPTARGDVDRVPGPAPGPAATADAERFRAWDAERTALVDRLRAIEARAEHLATGARLERATYRFVDTLEEFVAARARRLAVALEGVDAAPPAEALARARELEVVLRWVEGMIDSRRTGPLRAALGDADAFAAACYEPIAEFARAEGLPLTSNAPVCVLGAFDLSIWTGFIPTGLAPIFLPRDFFDRIVRWPALAHEIAHDFYNATRGFDGALRAQLGLPPAEIGARPLAIGPQGLTVGQLRAVFGAWLEELFCDVFGALMCGEAYAWTMIEEFARPDAPGEVVAVGIDPSGRLYDEHPPRHLRVEVVARALDAAGCAQPARAVLANWNERHGGEPDGIYFPMGGGYVGLPIEPLRALAHDLADRLYGEPLDALYGFRLADVPGVDLGPHELAEMERVRDELVAGRVPHRTDARAVVAGAVLAWRAAPEREREFLSLARRAIAAEGTFEVAQDAYTLPADRLAVARPAAGSALDPREAFVLHTVLSPPPAGRHVGLAPWRRGSVLARRGW
ncbi:MAG: hypothetical protein D6689_05205 [Deltaproteobacteria bacterium]|nr:MAG: hypothetical protein D6689_05205 [Deltaproteobacteria bacterium]